MLRSNYSSKQTAAQCCYTLSSSQIHTIALSILTDEYQISRICILYSSPVVRGFIDGSQPSIYVNIILNNDYDDDDSVIDWRRREMLPIFIDHTIIFVIFVLFNSQPQK